MLHIDSDVAMRGADRDRTDDLGAFGATLSLQLHASHQQSAMRGADRDRTDDLFVANEALSQTELQPLHPNFNQKDSKLSPGRQLTDFPSSDSQSVRVIQLKIDYPATFN